MILFNKLLSMVEVVSVTDTYSERNRSMVNGIEANLV
jgi:hypothetical protein